MALTIDDLALYLSHPASRLLCELPFSGWRCEISVETELDEPLTDYVFPDHGMAFTCDATETIATIFIDFAEGKSFAEGLLDVPTASTRAQMIERFGAPDRSNDGLANPIPGGYGPWDRFKRPSHSIHVERRIGGNRIKMVTLMRPDVVP